MFKAHVVVFKLTDGRVIHLDATMVESVTNYGEMSFIEMRSGAKHTVGGRDLDVLRVITDAAALAR